MGELNSHGEKVHSGLELGDESTRRVYQCPCMKQPTPQSTRALELCLLRSQCALPSAANSQGFFTRNSIRRLIVHKDNSQEALTDRLTTRATHCVTPA